MVSLRHLARREYTAGFCFTRYSPSPNAVGGRFCRFFLPPDAVEGRFDLSPLSTLHSPLPPLDRPAINLIHSRGYYGALVVGHFC